MPIYEATAATFFLLDSRNNSNTTYKMSSDNIPETRKTTTSFYKICFEKMRKGNSREQKKHNWPASHFILAVKMECVPLKDSTGQTLERQT